MESFYHKKIFSRAKATEKRPFWLIVPSDAILWAGPHLSDLAHHLGDVGHVMVPSLDGGFLEITSRPLAAAGVGPVRPEDDERLIDDGVHISERFSSSGMSPATRTSGRRSRTLSSGPRSIGAGSGACRSTGILFFGPPGCGKSRWAQAIAGELEQEIRLLGPSDLRGPFIGWGQIQIREQFDWLAGRESRMLIIDELDGVAHSRHDRQMHTDEKASVNELLIQVDRVLKLGRMLAATTNFIGSLDEALTRSGRFGRFIPVAPPDLDEATQIVVFYLAAMAGASGADNLPTVRVPDEARVRAILEPLYVQGLGEGRFFCGADLEAAVNGAYVRSVREALPSDGWVQGAIDDIVVSEDVLADSLSAAPRSIQGDSIDRFLSDVDRYCGGDLAATIARRLPRSDRKPSKPAQRIIPRGEACQAGLVAIFCASQMKSWPFAASRSLGEGGRHRPRVPAGARKGRSTSRWKRSGRPCSRHGESASGCFHNCGNFVSAEPLALLQQSSDPLDGRPIGFYKLNGGGGCGVHKRLQPGPITGDLLVADFQPAVFPFCGLADG